MACGLISDSFSPHCVLAHARLAVMAPQHGQQPLSLPWQGRQATIAYNGELYNAPELRRDLEALGFSFSTRCDTEVALAAYNAGMGNVSQWLESGDYSHDGETLHTIPYPETDAYVEKVQRAYQIYQKLYP